MTLKAELAPLDHGGNLGAARQMFPAAPEPFLDLSTGINPHPYPVPQLPSDALTRLPEQAALAKLIDVAAEAYGAPSPAHVAAGPGSQILVAQTAFLLARGRASVLAPTYSEHARAAELAGHNVVEVADVMQLAESRIAIVVNPNNPDGRIVAKDALLALADRLRRRGGLLLVDEAFMEVGPYGVSLADQVERGNIVVLRSFGKFYGLPGLRLSFAIAPPEIAARLAAALGTLAGQRRCARHRRRGPCRYGLAGGDARASGRGCGAARWAARQVGARDHRRDVAVPPGAGEGSGPALSQTG
jgi:cobalamin biosynthetic protein CobC